MVMASLFAGALTSIPCSETTPAPEKATVPLTDAAKLLPATALWR